MTSILVPIGGADSDEVVFETALAAARPLEAHLQFLHVRIGAGAAARNTPHVAFVGGAALRDALDELESQSATRSAAAARHVRAFCARANVSLCERPGKVYGLAASWREEEGDALERILFHARHSDLVVVGRSRKSNGLPADMLELLLLRSGRPVLIAGPTPPPTLTRTVMVFWKESADAARAVTAAAPLLEHAERVILASVAEGGEDMRAAMNDLATRLAWSNIAADVQILNPNGQPLQQRLADAARAHAADLIVMGAYGHSHLREALFGGCTQSFLREGDRPILLMH